MRVTTISADGENGLSVDVQEPKNHVNVDRYVVASSGAITGPTPVKLMSLDAHVNQWEIGGVGPNDRRYLYLDASRGRPVAILRPDLTIADMRY